MSELSLDSSLGLGLAVWLFALGGAVGSFLNVVVYRLPLGLSLVSPGSHCPVCKHPIRWHDNLPIVGWFLLRGRCRDCRTRISFRYPLVEAVTAVLFLTVGMADGDRLAGSEGFGMMLGLTAYHGMVLATLLVAALIQYDGQRPPPRLFVPAILVGFLAPTAWPHLRPPPTVFSPAGPLGGVFEGMVAALMGFFVGYALCLLLGPRDRRELSFGLAVAGLFLGGLSILAVGLLLGAIHTTIQVLKTWRPGLQRTTPGIWLFVLVWAWALAWTPLVERFKMP